MNEEYFTFHLQYKHSATFANRKCEERILPPKKKSVNVRPHSSNSIENATPLYIYSQSRGENTTPSGGASPLASYKEVPPPRMTYASVNSTCAQRPLPGLTPGN